MFKVCLAQNKTTKMQQLLVESKSSAEYANVVGRFFFPPSSQKKLIMFCFVVLKQTALRCVFRNYGRGAYFPSCKTSWVASTEERVHLLPFHIAILWVFGSSPLRNRLIKCSSIRVASLPAPSILPLFHPVLLSPLCQLSLRQSVTLCSLIKAF